GYRQHGGSGVGGSNPLVPTKIPLKNQPVRAVFLWLNFLRGSYGVKLGNKAVEIRRNLRLIHQFAHCSVSEFINTQIFISNYCINSL
ncbi:Gifsy-2 prophage protein, partial [Salmonella enterica subsp. enterica serovar Enteritidis str. 13183-1]